jgi:membrane protease YdiL (CAAX protease family)
MMLTPREENPSRDNGESVPHLWSHHCVPIVHGRLGESVFEVAAPPPVNLEAARQPRTSGLPPLRHVVLPPPEAFQTAIPPQLAAISPTRAGGSPFKQRLGLPEERVTFPVAKSPGFRPLSSSTLSEAPSLELDEPSPPPPAPPAPQPTAPAGPTAHRTRLDPLYLLALYIALGLGTLVIEPETRYAVLWVILAAVGALLTLVDPEKPPDPITGPNLIWGLGIGLVIGLPLLILTGPGLADTSRLLFPDASPAMLLMALVFAVPLSETLFFRGALQERHGLALSIVGAGLSTVLLYWPAASSSPIYLIAVAVFYTVLAGIYSFIRDRYGLAAAYLCQVTINLMLIFLPRLIF